MRQNWAEFTICTMILTIVIGACVALRQPKTERIEEDDPRWDCRTMGNKICGPGH